MTNPTEPLSKVVMAGGYGRRFPRRGHYVLHAGLGAAAFLTTCLILHVALPGLRVPEVSSKLRYFAANKDQFDTIFIGSSRIERHVIPEVFDRVAADTGLQTRSFNFGIGGMHPPESFYVLKQILRQHPGSLKRVFVEVEELYPAWLKEDTGTLRSLYWHDWPSTWLVVQKSLDPDGRRPWYRMAVEAMWSKTVHAHLSLFLKRAANVGRANDLIVGAESILPNDSQMSYQLERDRGYSPHAQNNDDPKRYEARLRKWSARRPAVDGVTDRGYRDCAARVRNAGMMPIFVVPPNPSEAQFRFPEPVPAPTLSFNERTAYPVLYEQGMRTDPQHLTIQGANVFSELLAQRFVREVAQPR